MSPAGADSHQQCATSVPRRLRRRRSAASLEAIEQPELDLGSDVGVRPPARVLADIAHTRVPVLWMGDNVEQLFAAQPTATRSETDRGPDTLDVPLVDY